MAAKQQPQQQQQQQKPSDGFSLALDDSVLNMLLQVQPWPSTMAELHERFAGETTDADGVTTKRSGSGAAMTPQEAKQLEYLVTKVFPTLVPAMNDLTEVVRRDVDARTGHPAAPPTFQPTKCSPAVGEGAYKATAVVHPIVWLAQRLMRGGPDRGVASDAEHPFCELLRRAPPELSAPGAKKQ